MGMHLFVSHMPRGDLSGNGNDGNGCIVILYLMYDNQKVMMEQLKKQIDQNQEIINWMKKND
jgi:hypothetical protein